jgi:translocation protein SEC66
MVYWVGLAVPLAYLSILVGSLVTFSSLYRKRQLSKSTSLEPWFGPHLQRDIYLSLLHIEPEPGQEKSPTIPDSILKAALLQRAVEDIRRILSIRSAKQALSNLVQRGSVGDDLWQRFQRAENEIQEEVRDVVNEANALAATWGNTILQSANEMVNNELIRQKLAEIQAEGKADRDWWERKRATTQSEFMKELDQNTIPGPTSGSNPGPTPNTVKSANPQAEKVGSDEDAVLVEGGGPASSGSAKGGAKKRKGKK